MSRIQWILLVCVLPFVMAAGVAIVFSPRLQLVNVATLHVKDVSPIDSAASLLFTRECIDSSELSLASHQLAYCNHGVWLLFPDSSSAAKAALAAELHPFVWMQGETLDVLALFIVYGLLAVVMPLCLLLGSMLAAWAMAGHALEPQRIWILRHQWYLIGVLVWVVLSGFAQPMAPGDFATVAWVALLIAVMVGVGVRYAIPSMRFAGLLALGATTAVTYAGGLYGVSFWGLCWWSGVLLVSTAVLLVCAIGLPVFSRSSSWVLCLLLFLSACLLRDFFSINIGLLEQYVSYSPWLLSLLSPGYMFLYGVLIVFWFRMASAFSFYPNLFRVMMHQYRLMQENVKNQWAYTNVSYLEKMHKKEREVVLYERSAIYRELHDGVSSQLITLLFGVKSGSASFNAIELGLSRCLNQIKGILMGAAMDHGKSVQDVFFDYCFGLDDLFGDGYLIFEYHIDGADYCFLDNSAHDLLKIFQEAVANALKHSGARRLHLSLQLTDSDIKVIFTESELSNRSALTDVTSSGVGLLSQQQRAEEIGGEFSCQHLGEKRVTTVRVALFNRSWCDN